MKTVVYANESRLACSCNTAPVNVTLCISDPTLVALKGCSGGGSETYRESNIQGVIQNFYRNTAGCEAGPWEYVIGYDETQLTTPSVALTSAQVTGVFCNGCMIKAIQEWIGNEVVVVDNSNNTVTITTQHGCAYTFSTGGSGPAPGTPDALIFGDGSDGALHVVSAQTYLQNFTSRNLALTDLTIDANGTYLPYGQAYFNTDIPARPTPQNALTGYWFLKTMVSDTLTVNGTIDASGFDGSNGSTGSAVQINSGSPAADDGDGGGGDWGGPGGGANSTTKTGTLPLGFRNGSTGQMGGGFGGRGGAGGSDGSTPGYAGKDPQADNGGVQAGYPYKINDLRTNLLDSGGPYSTGNACIIGGGTGGGGGGAGYGGSNGGDGGGGGGGGGTIFLVAKNVVLGATSLLKAKGGKGGNGGNGSGTSVTTYTLSGHVQDTGAVAMSGVTVNAGSIGITTTDSSGNFSFSGIAAGTNYTVAFSKSGYSFSNTPQSGTLTSNTSLATSVGTVVSGSYSPITIFPSGTPIGWYAPWSSSTVLHSGSPATNGQTVDSITDSSAAAIAANQSTPANQPTLVTGVINGRQAIEWDVNSGALLPAGFTNQLNSASSVLFGWVGSLTDGSANGHPFFTSDGSYSYPRVAPFFTGNEPSGEWNTADGVDQGNQAISSSPLLTGITNYHACLWFFNFAAGQLTIWQDNVKSINNYTHGTAQALPNTNSNAPGWLLNMKGRTADVFGIKNHTLTDSEASAWFASVKSFFGLTAY